MRLRLRGRARQYQVVRVALVLCVLVSWAVVWRTHPPHETTPSSLEGDVGAVWVAVSDPAVRLDVDYAVAGMAPDGSRAPDATAVMASVVVHFWATKRQYRGFDALVVTGGRAWFADPVRPLAEAVRTPNAMLTRYSDGLTYRHGPFQAYSCLGRSGADGSRSPHCSSRHTAAPPPWPETDTQRFTGRPYLAPRDEDRKGSLWSAGTLVIVGPLAGRLGTAGSYESHVAFPAVGSTSPVDRVLPLTTSDPGPPWYVPPHPDIEVRAMTLVDDARYDITSLRPAPRSTEGEPGGSRLRWVSRTQIAPAYRVVDKAARARFLDRTHRVESRVGLWREVRDVAAGAVVGGFVAGPTAALASTSSSPRRRQRSRKRRKR